jgi:hypothetical protein
MNTSRLLFGCIIEKDEPDVMVAPGILVGEIKNTVAACSGSYDSIQRISMVDCDPV